MDVRQASSDAEILLYSPGISMAAIPPEDGALRE